MSPLLTLRRNVPAPNRLRRVGPAPNCPNAELAAPSWPRRIGVAESAAPSCPISERLRQYACLVICRHEKTYWKKRSVIPREDDVDVQNV